MLGSPGLDKKKEISITGLFLEFMMSRRLLCHMDRSVRKRVFGHMRIVSARIVSANA